MKVNCIFQTARCAAVEIEDGGIFETEKPYEIYVNDVLYGSTERVITSIYGLKPVSYTHLDVYKRQGCALRDGRI